MISGWSGESGSRGRSRKLHKEDGGKDGALNEATAEERAALWTEAAIPALGLIPGNRAACWAADSGASPRPAGAAASVSLTPSPQPTPSRGGRAQPPCHSVPLSGHGLSAHGVMSRSLWRKRTALCLLKAAPPQPWGLPAAASTPSCLELALRSARLPRFLLSDLSV